MFTYYKKALAFLCCTAAVTGLPARAAEKPAVEINLDVLNSLLLSTVQAPAAKPAYPKPAAGGADFLNGGVPAPGNYPAPNGVGKFAGGEPPVPPSPYYEQQAAAGLPAPAQQRGMVQAPQAVPWQPAPGTAAGRNAAIAARIIQPGQVPGQPPVQQQANVQAQAPAPQGQVPAQPAPAADVAPANLPKKGNIYTAENLESPSGSSWFNSVNGFRNAPPVVQRPGQQERYSFVTPEADANAGDLAAETLPWKNREAVRTGRPAPLEAQRRAYNNVPSLSMKQTPFAGIPLGPTTPSPQGGMQGGLSAPSPVPGLGGGMDPFAAARKSMAAGMRPGMIVPGGPLGGMQQKGRFAMQTPGRLQAGAVAPAAGKRRAPIPEGVVPVPQFKPDPGARLALAQDIPADEGVPTFNASEGGAKGDRFGSGAESGKKGNGFGKPAESDSREQAKGRKKGKGANAHDAEDAETAKNDDKVKKNGKIEQSDLGLKDVPAKPEVAEGAKKDGAKPDDGQQITSLRDRIRALRMKRETGKAAEAEEASNGIPGVPFEDTHKDTPPSVPPLQEAAVPVPAKPVTPPAPAPSFAPPPAAPAPTVPAVPAPAPVPVTPPPPPAPPEDPSLAALKGLAQADKAEKSGAEKGNKPDASAKDVKGKAPKPDDHAPKAAAPAAPSGGGSAVSFTPGADSLSDAQKAQLDGFIKSVQGGTGKINIVGYASAGGEGSKSPEYISLKRVVAVRNYIMNKGLTHDRIMIKAKGDKVENPSQNDTVQLIVGN